MKTCCGNQNTHKITYMRVFVSLYKQIKMKDEKKNYFIINYFQCHIL